MPAREIAPESQREEAGSPPSKVVCVGASAGGVEALGELVSGLAPDLDAAVVIVLHLSAASPGLLATILQRRSQLPVGAAEDLMPIRRGTVVVAQPDAHLLVHKEHFRVARGPRENGHRPSIDALFRSAAVTWGRHSVVVVLTGALDDGAAGAAAIAAAGGTVIAQDPDDATVPDMPRHACERVPDAKVAPLADIPELIAQVVKTVTDHVADEALHPFATTETAIAAGAPPLAHWPGDAVAAGLSCPDCDGSLFMVPSDGYRLRCRVGHAWTYEGLAAQHDSELEAALALAARIISDDLTVQDRLAERARDHERRFALARIDARRAEGRHLLTVLEAIIRRIGDPLAPAAEPSEQPG
ncbi:MAG TPA: chemotaxis protein CheB [Acidimicrobiia bacterium]